MKTMEPALGAHRFQRALGKRLIEKKWPLAESTLEAMGAQGLLRRKSCA
jgi:hypothetical protein